MGGHRIEHLKEIVQRFLVAEVLPLRRHIIAASAFTFVVCSVLLSMYARLPFPPPGERILYDPSDWSLLFDLGGAPSPRQEVSGRSPQAVGGLSTIQAPVKTLMYMVQPGDTMSGIAIKLGMTVDTISSMNRVEGRGVHSLTVGEQIKIPTQDGIVIPLNGDFDALCAKYKAVPEDVLAANVISRDDLRQGMPLFFPGVQHTGYQLALFTGVGIKLPLHGWESSPFGRRADPFTGLPSRHSGIDIAAPYGSLIRSATPGIVVRADWDTILGNYVEVKGPLGFTYYYGHMSEIRTQVGARVAQEQIIGLVGDSGYATGPHLHFEVRKNGQPVNPQSYLPPIR